MCNFRCNVNYFLLPVSCTGLIDLSPSSFNFGEFNICNSLGLGVLTDNFTDSNPPNECFSDIKA